MFIKHCSYVWILEVEHQRYNLQYNDIQENRVSIVCGNLMDGFLWDIHQRQVELNKYVIINHNRLLVESSGIHSWNIIETADMSDTCTHTAHALHTYRTNCTQIAHISHTLHTHCSHIAHTAHTLYTHCTYILETAKTMHKHCTHIAHTAHTLHTLHTHCTHIAHTEFLKVADTQTHICAKFSTSWAKFWLLNKQL